MRRAWLDNLRWGVILLVVLFHAVCAFNSCGMPLGVGPGVPAFDLIGYFCYPWFMALMFLLAGMSTRFALERRTAAQFMKERRRRLLLPLLSSLVLLGPPLVAVQWGYNGVSLSSMLAALPPPVVALIAMMAGMGPQWFLLALYVYTLLLLPVRRRCGARQWGWPGLFLLLPVLWISSLLPPAPDRYGLYFAAFLMGYFVFSREDALQRAQKGRLPLLAAALGFFIFQLPRYWGASFTASGYLTNPVTILFLWCALLAALGCAQAWWDTSTAATRFLAERGFSLYLFHYLPLVWAAFFVTRNFTLPPMSNYLTVLVPALGAPLVLHALLKRVPFLGFLFGMRSGSTSPTPASPRG